MTVVLLVVVAVVIFWLSVTYGLDVFGKLFPEGFFPSWWNSVLAEPGYHFTTFLLGALIFTLIGALKSR